MDSKYKQDIINSANNLVKSLYKIDKLSLDNVTDENLINSFENIKTVISKGISSIQRHLETLSKTAEWDKLNVAFFGETNAGKSTIIEALINGDGRSIGEGYKDFTKTINVISYKNINLVDMPGIEGKENKVIKNIKKAINKSHIIFYVIGTNKEPEEHTISKIRRLLKDNAKVYSIINVRGKPNKYQKELKSDNTIILENKIKKRFSEILGNNYGGNIVVNAYIAFLRSSRIRNTRFEKDQIKALKIFGDKNNIEKFSNIQDIYNLFDSFEKDIKNEIVISNTYKFIKNINIILSNILKEKKNFDLFLKETDKLTKKYLEETEAIIQNYKRQIENTLEVKINSLRVKLKNIINKGIDESYREQKIYREIDRIKQEQEKELNMKIQELLSSMKTEVENKIKEFKDRMSLQLQFTDIKGAIDLKSILESLDKDFKYVLKQILDAGFSIGGVVIAFGVNPILGVITGIVALARKIWDWFFGDPDKRKREAKRKAAIHIDSELNNVKKTMTKNFRREYKSISKKIQEPVTQMRSSMKGLKKISRKIDEIISEIRKTQVTLSTLLMKKVIGERIELSYIDLQLSKAVIIGNEVSPNEKKHLLDILRLKEVNFYSSYEDWLNNAGNYFGNESFLAKDEFNYRAASSLAIYDIGGVKFRKIERRVNK